MNKELIDRTWACLPREFREEVKKLYTDALDASNSPHDPDDRKWGNYRVTLLEKLFGRHNLTSDAEEEEMLTVSRKRVQEIYTQNQNEIIRENVSSSDKDCYETVNEVLKTLFGSKCLPDEEPKPAEPKFKRGDRVRIIKQNHPQYGKTATVDTLVIGAYPEVLVNLGGNLTSFDESDLEPYTEPKAGFLHADGEVETSAPTFTDECKSQYKSQSRNLSQGTANCDKHFDNILKDSLAKERRLNIAATIASGWLAYHGMTSPETIAMDALAVADALIKKCEKGDRDV